MQAGPFTAIGLQFVVQSADRDIVRRVGSVLASLTAEVAAEHLYDLPPPASNGRPQQWLVDPNRIRAEAVASPVPVGLVVSPRYEPGAPTTVTPLRKSETIALVVQNSFNFAPFGRRGLEALAEI